jgi:hypothetical protein
MKRTVQAKLLIVGVFVVGLLTGAVLLDVYETRVFSRDATREDRAGLIRDNERPSYVEYLELTPEQNAEIRRILDNARDEVRQLRRETRPLFDAISEDSRDRIRALLSESQRERYNEWIIERDERGRNDRRRD